MGLSHSPVTVLSGLALYLDASNPKSYPRSGTTWTNLFGSNGNATLVNGPVYNSLNGGNNGIIVFNGTNNEVTTATQFTNPQTFSIGAWFKTSTASGKKIIGFETNQTGTGSGSYDRQIWIGTDGKLYFGIYDGAIKQATSPLTYADNNWHYVVGTYVGTTMTLYVDGVSVATATASSAQNINGYWRIGGYRLSAWSNASDGYFTGNIGIIQVYNRGINAAEVLQNYNALASRFVILPTTGLITDGLTLNLDAANTASYPGSGTTWTDISGNSNNATLVNGPTYSIESSGFIVFDGTNDEVTTTTTSPNIQSFSIGAWFRTSTAAGKKIIGFETNQTGTGSTAWDRLIYIGSDGKLYFGIYDGALKVATSPLTYNDNTWHYVVGTYGNQGTTMRLYVDGVSVATNTASSLTQSFNGYWRIGGYKTNSWPNASDGYFTGAIRTVQVYNRGINAAEVSQNYNARPPEYETLTYTASGNLTVTGNGTNTVNIFKTSGGSAWDNQAYSLIPFTAPCTIEFNKQAASGDNGVSYAMIGWNADPLTNASYDTLDYASYPYRTDVYSVHHNSVQVHFSGSWSTANKFYVVYGTDGTIKHYNGSTLLYSVNYGTGNTVYVDSSFYSVNATFGGFSNIKVIRSAWNGANYVA